jgi:hypothetical protein
MFAIVLININLHDEDTQSIFSIEKSLHAQVSLLFSNAKLLNVMETAILLIVAKFLLSLSHKILLEFMDVGGDEGMQ